MLKTVFAVPANAPSSAVKPKSNNPYRATPYTIGRGTLIYSGCHMPLPSLDSLLEYKNPAVLKLYIQNYPDNTLSAEDAFRETLKYLWLAKKHEIDSQENTNNPDFPDRCIMPISMREIDQMWHEFILFTEDYTHFCQHYFGEYMHHLPNIFDNLPPISREEENREIEKLLHYIYDNLGEDTVRVWFANYLDAA